MPNITNKHEGRLSLPGGIDLQPGETVQVADWSAIKDHGVVNAWVKAGVIEVEITKEEADAEAKAKADAEADAKKSKGA